MVPCTNSKPLTGLLLYRVSAGRRAWALPLREKAMLRPWKGVPGVVPRPSPSEDVPTAGAACSKAGTALYSHTSQTSDSASALEEIDATEALHVLPVECA